MKHQRAEVAIAVEGLEKSYHQWPVLWDLDLTVPWGETLALFGANGAGKTTLLRILSTSVRPDAGTVRIAGRDLRRQTAEARRLIGVVGHRSFLYEDLTARENLNYYARLYGVKDRDARVRDALERVGLTSRANHRVRTLSNGMQKRAAIARAILHRPSVLLLDEPEAGLDRDSRRMLGELLAEWTTQGLSAAFTTHDIALGLEWGHRAALLTGGKLEFPASGEREILAALSPSRASASHPRPNPPPEGEGKIKNPLSEGEGKIENPPTQGEGKIENPRNTGEGRIENPRHTGEGKIEDPRHTGHGAVEEGWP